MAISPLPPSISADEIRKIMEQCRPVIMPDLSLRPVPSWIHDPGHTHNFNPFVKDDYMAADDRRFSPDNMRQMLLFRMGWNVTSGSCPFKTWYTHKISDTQAAVIALHAHDVLVIRDDLKLYPSDALVTQLRLLEPAE